MNDQVTNLETAKILELAQKSLDVAGDFVELGCYRGDTSVLLAKLLQKSSNFSLKNPQNLNGSVENYCTTCGKPVEKSPQFVQKPSMACAKTVQKPSMTCVNPVQNSTQNVDKAHAACVKLMQGITQPSASSVENSTQPCGKPVEKSPQSVQNPIDPCAKTVQKPSMTCVNPVQNSTQNVDKARQSCAKSVQNSTISVQNSQISAQTYPEDQFISSPEHSPRRLYLYDSFAGLPAKTPADQSGAGANFQAGELLVTKREVVTKIKRAGLHNVIIKKAWFSELTPGDLPEEIAFAFIDGDFYESQRDGLRLVAPNLAKQGIIICHDYNNPELPGATRAVDEFLHANPHFRLQIYQTLAILTKNQP